MNEGLKRLVEQYFIECFRANKMLKGKSIVHQEEAQKVKPEQIVIKAMLGEHLLDGPLGYLATVECTYYSTLSDPKRNGLVFDAMRQAIVEAVATRAKCPSAGQFPGYVEVRDEDMTSDESTQDNFRSMKLTVPFRIGDR